MRIETWVSQKNSSNTALAVAGTFTGSWEDTTGFQSVIVAAKSDQDGTLYVDFSPDGVNLDSTLTFEVNGNINEVHRLTCTRKYYRVRYLNDGVAQTYMRLQCTLGHHAMLTSPLNQAVQPDADATTVRSINTELALAAGLFTGFSIVNKFGRNPDIDQGTLPEDICGAGGVYVGFPTGAAELVRVVSSSANDAAAGSGARTIIITGLDANYNVQNETITLNGTTPVASVNTFSRVHTARISTSGSSNAAFNAGTITISHNTTTANVFAVMQIGYNQTQESAYTIPAGYTGYLTRIHGGIRGATAASADISIWVRNFGESPRLRRPTSVNQGGELDDNILGGLILPEKADIVMRCTSVSATNNSDVVVGYDMYLVKNAV
jgi:hypothetical protein